MSRLIKIPQVFYIDNGALNCMCFACSGLTVRENGTVISLHTTICNGFGNVIEDSCLIDLLTSHKVEAELLGVEAALQENCALVNLHAFGSSLSRMLLSLVEWSDTYANLHVVLLVLLVLEEMRALFHIGGIAVI